MRPSNAQPAVFWSKVDRSGGPEACWPWRLSLGPHGYGQVKVGKRPWLAHRLAFRMAYGVEPGGMHVLHSCDVPPCCNPAHLRLGTRQDNMADMRARGRAPLGERAGGAKLTEAAVQTIRRDYRPGPFGTGAALGRRFGVTSEQVRKVARGQSWAWFDADA